MVLERKLNRNSCSKNESEKKKKKERESKCFRERINKTF